MISVKRYLNLWVIKNGIGFIGFVLVALWGLGYLQQIYAQPACANPIVCENANPGNPASEWDISGAGDPSIQGFATDISVDQGQTVHFKINTNALDYRLDIYRMGYYGGMGARKITSILPAVTLPQNQPSCLSDQATGLVDCGNWAESASWTVPITATSGIYFAKLIRTDTNGASHIVFIIRDDDGGSDLLFQTADTTWQAYNIYGGASLYTGFPAAGRAYKVSYNRPFSTREGTAEDWVFNAEYPMVRWLEANGYNVSYFTGIDSDRFGAEILEHKVFLSVGHDEYWSNTQRANVEAARAAGIHLAFFSGNEIFWKIRWENSVDGANTPYRTLVAYKETHANAKIDPEANIWTGTWRDPRFSPPADGGRPENALTGTFFRVTAGTVAIQVPAADGKMRFWRNTSVATLAPGETATLANDTLGYEWDEDADNGFRPAGLIRLSTTTNPGAFVLTDHGSTYVQGAATHNMTLYRHNSGALVFGAGTIQWSWGLDGNHDRGASTPDVRMQQATVNLLADMDVQPATLQPGLVVAVKSTDGTAPSATITAPLTGATVQNGSPVLISGTATDVGGVVGGVEVSVDGGATWRRANGRENWSYSWTPTALGTATILSRAVDDSGNLGVASNAVTVTIAPLGSTCPCTIWAPTSTPVIAAQSDPSAIEVGVKFRSDLAGYITGIRFYKGTNNTGTHVGHLWSSSGQLLASATFVNEGASGWQQVDFGAPIPITANTTYVASYHTDVGFYAYNEGYFTSSGVDNAPLRALANGVDGNNGVYRYGASSFPTDSFNGANYWVDVVFVTTVPPDTTPPTVFSVLPAAGATNIAIDTTLTVNFNEAMDGTTINATTIELRDAANNLIPATVSYQTINQRAILTPTTPLQNSTRYTATVRGGMADPRVKDVAGNALATNYTWSFTTTAPIGSNCPCTIWPATATPAIAAQTDANAIEVGVKFRSDLAGYITGIRFYKGAGNTGTHQGHLWSSSGQLLASATFVNETATGWQQVNFGAPIPISANTTYIASYHTDVGRYAFDNGYFATNGVNNPPLHALSNGVDGGNGVYQYGASAFPTTSGNAANYWVDVVFATEIGPDTTPPTVVAVNPGNGAINVVGNTQVTVTFDEAMDPASISATSFLLRDAANHLVAAAVNYNDVSKLATLVPTNALAYATSYTAVLKGGATEPRIKDAAGNALAADYTWSFTTEPPPPDDGPGGPILILYTNSNQFGRYYNEILRTEGFNAFQATDISQLSATLLSAYDVVILGEMPLNPTQVSILSDWVTAGGNLIAMRPDKQLASLLGLVDASSTLDNRYLLVNTTNAPGLGITPQTIQFHGVADLYTLAGAMPVATLYTDASTPTAMAAPAVTLRSIGANGGQAAAFTYDLARSIIYTRQGNPAWAGQERDGLPPIRSNDMFFGNAAGDPQADWVDLNKVAIPQADEQQRLLGNLILLMNADRKPLPRFWYFPKDHKAVVVMTGDDHGNGGTGPRFDRYLELSPAGCSVVDWECIRSTSYIYTVTPLSDAQAFIYNNAGFEVALHVNTNCADYTQSSLSGDYNAQLAAFRAKYATLPAPVTQRTHCIVWSDWATQAKIELQHGMRFDTTYYYWPSNWVNDHPGFFTGSGMIMRFADLDGSLINVYQAATQMNDEAAQSYPTTANTLFDRALGPEGYYGAFTTQIHTDFLGNHPLSEAVVNAALARGIPVVSSRQMLEWLDGRNSSSFSALTFANNTLSFSINVGAGANNLRAMLPINSAVGQLTGITYNGAPLSYTTATIKGIQYAIFPAQAGNYQAALFNDTEAPTVALTSPANGAVVLGTVAITATAADNFGVAGVQFKLDGVNLGVEDTISPYSIAWNTINHANGAHTLTAVARDGAGNVTTSSPMGVTINNPVDTTPPTVTSVTPANGATNVAIHTGLIVNFSEAMDAATVNATTIELHDGANNLVPATVSYNTGNQSATLTPSSPLANLTQYTAAVRGGNVDPRVKDVAGNPLAASYVWSFTTVAPPGANCPCTIWPSTATPAIAAASDPGAVELGVKFRSDLAGYITGIRFYKGETNTGAHEGHLWSSNGQLLASATFVNESASGWQQVNFPTPVAINANTTYIASYHTNVGQYAFNIGYFSSEVNTPPLRALANGVDGGNGVYRYGASAFPTDSSNAANYWVDVVFVTTVAPDTTPPTVISVIPTAGATNVPVGTAITIGFSEAMNETTVNGTTIELRDVSNTVIAATVNYNAGSQSATLTPLNPLNNSTHYTVTVRGGNADPRVKDAAGNALTANYAWSFTTAAPVGTNCPCTIWSLTTTPALPAASDPFPIEVGVKFRSDIAGYITGIRFYKGATNSGVHEGHLWSSTGQLLASATFVNESASGWQEVNFPVSVPINANTTYIASYHTDVGQYAFNSGYFTAEVNNPPLRALANGADGGNAVYHYGPSAFPTDSGNGSNYWVDVVFNTAPLPDTTTPTVALVNPTNEAVVAGSLTISATATDNVGVVGVQFWLDNANLGTEDTTPPYTFVWNSATVTNGVHQLTAVARDAVGNIATSVPVNVTVNNDAAAPTVSNVSPANGTTNVAINATLTINFSEAMDAATINATTIELRDGANNLVPATVSYNSGSQSASITPDSPLATLAHYTATVKGGSVDPRVKDVAGNALAANYTWSFTTAAPLGANCPCTIWSPTTTPATPAASDPFAIEVGVKFRSDIAGYITGIRFYKGTTNTGTHEGHLWSSTGQLLASATFVNETATGWQEALFPVSVPINANTTYIASYHTDVGQYAFNSGYFTSEVNNPPVRALANGADGGNAVYRYGPSAFPTDSGNGSNYWVDVIFATQPNPVVVPNVVNQPQAAAEQTIINTGLTVDEVTHTSSITVATGSVISQAPAAGTTTAPGSGVNLVISTGPPLVTTPNVVGQSQTAAQQAIATSGLIVGVVSQANSNSVPAGNVISQNPAAGTSILYGTAINLVISTGPAPVPLVVTKAGGGSGVVTSAPVGINCGVTCSAQFAYNTIVTLSAAPSTDSTFAGWSGACSGTGVCTVTLNLAKNVTATFSNLIFADGFESGTFSAWTAATTDFGNLSVSSTAASAGARGMRALINDNNSLYVTDDTPNAEPRYWARFSFDPNSIPMTSGNAHYIFYGYSGSSTVVLRLELRFSAPNYQLRVGLANNFLTWTTSSWFTISDAPHTIEIDWRAATSFGANNGYLTFWIDGVQRANLTGISNSIWRIDRIRLGPIAGIDFGTRGSYYFDDFESRRSPPAALTASGEHLFLTDTDGVRTEGMIWLPLIVTTGATITNTKG